MWERVQRKIIHSSPYMEAWQDSVRLPDGKVIDDYDGVTLGDGVLIIATDTEGKLLLFEEYKYAVNEMVLTAPAGGIDGDETSLEAAKRELLEETGYECDEFEFVAKLYPYPSKIKHANHIVRAKNARKVTTPRREATETIGAIQLIDLSDLRAMIKSGKFNTPYNIAALALTFPEYL